MHPGLPPSSSWAEWSGFQFLASSSHCLWQWTSISAWVACFQAHSSFSQTISYVSHLTMTWHQAPLTLLAHLLCGFMFMWSSRHANYEIVKWLVSMQLTESDSWWWLKGVSHLGQFNGTKQIGPVWSVNQQAASKDVTMQQCHVLISVAMMESSHEIQIRDWPRQ